MQSNASNASDPARLCAFNLGIQLLWGAILGLSLQARSLELGGNGGVLAYSIIAAAGALVATIVQPIAGQLSDALRRRSGNRQIFYLVGVLIALPALAWFYFAPNLPQLLGAFCALELGMNVAIGPYQAVIPDYVAPERRGRASSWMSGYQSLGNALGLVIAGFVHVPSFLVGAIGAGLVLSWLVSVVYLKGRDALPEVRASALAPHGEAAASSTHRVVSSVLIVLLVSRGLINVGFFTLLGFLLFYVRQSLGVGAAETTTQTGYLFLTFTLFGIAGALVAARPTDRTDKRAVVSITCAIVVVALAVLATAASFPVALGAAVFAGAAWGAFVTADWALAAAVLPGGAMALSMGIWNVATTLPQVIAPLVTAPLVQTFNARAFGLGPRAAIVLAALEFVAGGALIWRLPRA